MIIDFNKKYNLQEEILNKVSEQSIYEYYLHQKVSGNLIKCCFHKDKSPSLGFYKSSSNNLYFKCFGCGVQGGVFNFVMKYHNCNYGKALQLIKKDLNIKENENTTISRESINMESFEAYNFNTNGDKKTTIIPVFRDFTIIDYNYWSQYHIPLNLLLEYDINACKLVYTVTKKDEYKLIAEHQDKNPIYCYTIDDSYKIYRPLNPDKKYKWFANTNLWDIQGLKQLPKIGKTLFITSSMKDVLVLKVLGYKAIALGGEGNNIPNKILDYLFASFEEIIIFYDNDVPGINYGKNMSQRIGCRYIHIPVEYSDTKDISDFIAKYGYEETECLLNTII